MTLLALIVAGWIAISVLSTVAFSMVATAIKRGALTTGLEVPAGPPTVTRPEPGVALPAQRRPVSACLDDSTTQVSGRAAGQRRLVPVE